MRKQSSEKDLVNILIEKAKGKSWKDIASTYKAHPRTVSRRIQTYHEEESLWRKKHVRKLKLDAIDFGKLENFVKDYPFSSIKDITNVIDKVSSKTAIRYCKSFVIFHYVSPKEFSIKAEDREKRVNIAIQLSRWSMQK